MMVRAKFRLDKVDGGEIQLFPVYSEDPNHENKAFWDATPGGSIQLFIQNPKAIQFFAQAGNGAEFYIDFTKAE